VLTFQTKVNEIARSASGGIASCTVHLTPSAPIPSAVHVIVRVGGADYEVAQSYAGQATNTWSLSADGATLELLGKLCTSAQAGAYQAIRFESGCVSLPTLPAPL